MKPRTGEKRLAFVPSELGPPAVYYRVELQDVTEDEPVFSVQDNLAFENNAAGDSVFVMVELEYNHFYLARVVGVDADGDAGTASDWSDRYFYPAPPPNPGTTGP